MRARNRSQRQRAAPRSDGQPPADWLVGGGEMGELVRSTDWTRTPLGPRERWPQSLRTVVNLVLETRFPKALLWGPELILLYNDAYRVIAAERHPRALGRSTREIWPEVWDINEPIFTAVLERGESIYLEDKLFPIDRHGKREDAYFTLCYSPVRVEDGHVAGSLVTLLETTGRVRAQRTLETARDRAEAAAERERETLAAVVRSIPDEVWFADTNRIFTLANPAALKEFALAKGETVEVEKLAASLEVLRPDGTPRPVEEAPPIRALTGETIRNQEEAIRTPATGDLRWREVSASPVRDARARIIGSVSVVRDITERKQAEEAVRRSQRTLAELVERAPFGIYIVDSGFRIAQMNASSQDGAFRNVRPVIGRDFSEAMRILWPEPVAAEIVAAFRHTLDSGEPFYSPRFINPRHDIAMVESYEWELHQITLPDGRHGVICYYFDSTKLRQAEEALREGEALLRAVIDTIAEPLYVKDGEGRLTLVNAATVEVVGKPREQIVGHTDREFYEDPAVVEAIFEHDRRVMESGTVQVFEERVPTPNGYRIMLNTKAPRRDASGRVVGLVGVARDITDFKRAAEQKTRILREIDEQRTRLQTIVDSLPVGLWLADGTGKMLLVNDRARTIWGGKAPASTSVAEYGVYRLWEAESGKLVAPEETPLARALRGEVCREIVLDFERFDGTRGTQLVSASPVKAPDGNVHGAVAVVQDITERRRLETALVEADRRKNEFLAVLSHELRNPLAPIANSLYILEHAPAQGEQANRARQVISRQVAHLSDLVNDLLDVTRITRNKVQLQRERLELNEVVRRAVEDNRSLFERADVHLSLAPAPRPVPVIADRTRVVQIVGNLLQNAAKFTLKGGCTRVSVSTEANAAVVRVADDGVGIATETLRGLFQPFMQADHTLDRSKGGLGLGLALVKGLVELHGGSVSAHSEGLGRGTELVVRLPLDSGVALESEPTGLHLPKTRRRILIIEDNLDAADSLREALELGEHDVVTAKDGPEGLAKARMFRPEVVLCDLGLPGMDGFEVARALRADDRLKGTFLVALSGYALPDDLQRAAEAGFQHHLAKPPSLEKLEHLLAEVPPFPGNDGSTSTA